jgi:hypothetical protein
MVLTTMSMSRIIKKGDETILAMYFVKDMNKILIPKSRYSDNYHNFRQFRRLHIIVFNHECKDFEPFPTE